MKIGLHDHENNKYPNLALMKISAWHKKIGDSVEWFNPLFGNFNKVYSSKVFTWTPESPYLPDDAIIGGAGSGNFDKLPDEIEHICPDYSIYNYVDKSYGFLTRGCVRDCSFCSVRQREGYIKKNADIPEFCKHKEVILMDNNVLSCEHGLEQIDKIAKLGLRVDFNQGLDARLIDSSVAKRLSKIKWVRHIRLACDSAAMIEPIRKAVELLRWHNAATAELFCYVLVKDIDDALERVRFLKGLYILPFAQPFRDKDGTPPTLEQKQFARWCNHKAAYKSSTWNEYKKGLQK